MSICRLTGYNNYYELGNGSLAKLVGVHPDLVMIVKLAIRISEVDFSVIDGVRTMERQKRLFESGESLTLKSKHLTGHAVDLAAWVDGESNFEWHHLANIYVAMTRAANLLGIKIVWGGNWTSFKDGPHFQLDV